MPAPQAKLDAARRLLDVGAAEQARDLLRPLATRFADELLPTAMLTEALVQLRGFEQAEYHAKRLAARFPREADTWTVHTQLRLAQRRLADAEAAARRAIELDARNGMRYRNLALVHYAQEDELAMAEAARLGSAVDPLDPDLRLKHATGLMSVGRSEESCALFRAAVADFPDDLPLAEGYAVALNYAPDVPRAELRAAHERFGTLLAARYPADPRLLVPRSPRPAGPRRVGLLSPDLRRHSVACFAEAIFRHHDRAAIDLFAYSTTTLEDEVSAQLRGCLAADRWRSAPGLDPAELARLIATDQIDVLVDLGGLFQNHSLAAVAQRPAPILLTHIGYPATTGLPGVLGRLVDALTDPPGEGEAAMTERPIRLAPCFLAYTPPTQPPAITWSPPARGELTFGSFNMISKINRAVLGAWATLLARHPGARLLIKARGLQNPRVRADLLSRAAEAGLDTGRVEILPPTAGTAEHLDLYNRVDVALDTFPYHGTTTTCEALLMGVPVVTIAGDRHAGRVGVSLLTAVGRPDLIVPDVRAYIEAAPAACQARTEDRLALRHALLSSPLTDGPAYGKAWSAAVMGL